MVENFRLDPSEVGKMLSKLNSDNSNFVAAVKELDDTLNRYEGCWGEDKAGRKFAEAYVSEAKKAQEALKGAGESVEDSVGGVRKVVQDFKTLDEDNAKLYDHDLAESMKEQEKK